MIRKVTVQFLKRFKNQEFVLDDHIILAGPNNCGKTTLLQAILIWNLALKTWRLRRTGSKARQRTGVPLTRQDFTVLPLREMAMLWTDTLTGLKREELAQDQKPGARRILKIQVEGQDKDKSWKSSAELYYENSELVRVKPGNDDEITEDQLAVDVVHIPPFSGIGIEETRYDRPYQDLLIGQGKAGEILRNLLLDVKDDDWTELNRIVGEIFGYHLLKPQYHGQPYIICEYLRGIPSGAGYNGLARLDLASAGSGFHQLLLILAFFYARPSSIILLDEPDAHLHVILQKQIYDTLRSIASQRHSQLIIATHSEVLIDNTNPEQILSFYDSPHILMNNVERDQIREAIKRIPATQLVAAEFSQGILYAENQSDLSLMRAWANVLEHPSLEWFRKKPFVHFMQGSSPQEARAHFFALQAIKKNYKGLIILDRDNKQVADRELTAPHLELFRWPRYEIESYLLHPAALMRFLDEFPLGMSYLTEQLPPAVIRNPLENNDFTISTPASKSILPNLFQAVGSHIRKQEYYRIAEQMLKEEISPDVVKILDLIHEKIAQ